MSPSMIVATLVGPLALWLVSSTPLATGAEAQAGQPDLAVPSSVERLSISTESVSLELVARGGHVVRWDVIDPRHAGAGAKASLIDPRLGPAGFGHPLEVITGNPGLDEHFDTAPYEMSRTRIEGGEQVRLISAVHASGLQLIKTLEIPERGFELALTLELINRGSAAAPSVNVPSIGLRVGPGLGPVAELEPGLFANFYKYVWPVFRSTEGLSTRPDLDAGNLSVDLAGEDETLSWAGLHDRYFLMALVPRSSEAAAAHRGRGYLVEGLTGQPFVDDETWAYLPRVELSRPLAALGSGEKARFEYTIYAGPKIPSELRLAQGDLGDVLFLESWAPMRWLCIAILWLMGVIHAGFGSWGIALVGLALVIRILLFPLFWAGLRAQAHRAAAMAELKPRLEKLREDLKDDPLERDKRVFALYKEHGVSPFGSLVGNLTLIVQIPIFIALFRVMGQAFELRGAEFLWISDLAEPDRLFPLGFSIPVLGAYFNLVPVLMSATQIASSLASSPPNADAQQIRRHRITMVGVGIGFFVLFYNFPSGMVLYWWIATFLAYLQQRWIGNRLQNKAQA